MKYNPSLPPLKAGDVLDNGKYEIVSDTENAGGFGRIYKARVLRSNYKSNIGNMVAVKEFHVHELDDTLRSRMSTKGLSTATGECYAKWFLKQFIEESKVLRVLSRQRDCHIPNHYHSAKEEQGRWYYTMSFIEGPTLKQSIEEHGPMKEAEAIDLVVQVAKVLHKAHAVRLYHCDVSPNNIMLDHGFAVLVDFGNAKGYKNLLQSHLLQTDGSTNHSLTDGALQTEWDEEMMESIIQGPIGTPGFAAPDHFDGKPQGDVFSLSAVLYFLLTGSKPPYYGKKNWMAKAREVLDKHDVSLTTIDAIVHALQPQLDICTQSARDFILELPNEIVLDTLLNYNDHDYNR